ncbi:DUF4044 domain-containing protein [uncultured Streptococcus sp.]|nr:DUF4044 domain-containing protein [uncultured Streptococcus sp.]
MHYLFAYVVILMVLVTVGGLIATAIGSII